LFDQALPGKQRLSQLRNWNMNLKDFGTMNAKKFKDGDVKR
jgi:hypothetical protein